MFKPLLSALVLTALHTACVSTASFNDQGFEHKRIGYSLAYSNPADKSWLNESWKIEKNHLGEVDESDYGSRRLEATDAKGKKQTMLVRNADLIFKHKKTNGVISVQSFPLNEFMAEKKLDIVAKDFAEQMSGEYFIAFSGAGYSVGKGRNLVTNLVSSQAGKLGAAETMEGVVEVANVEQLKLNPKHRLMRYKFFLARLTPENGWVDIEVMKEPKNNIEYRYPAMIVILYSMDDAYFNDYVADFDGLVKQLKLKR